MMDYATLRSLGAKKKAGSSLICVTSAARRHKSARGVSWVLAGSIPPHSFLAKTNRCVHSILRQHNALPGPRGVIRPGGVQILVLSARKSFQFCVCVEVMSDLISYLADSLVIALVDHRFRQSSSDLSSVFPDFVGATLWSPPPAESRMKPPVDLRCQIARLSNTLVEQPLSKRLSCALDMARSRARSSLTSPDSGAANGGISIMGADLRTNYGG